MSVQTYPASAVATAQVRFGGRAMAGTTQLLSARVAGRFNAPTQCELVVVDTAGSGWPAGCALGAALRLGVVGLDDPLFAGEITCVETVRGPDGESLTRVRGYDLLHRLRKRQTLRVMESVTAKSVAQTLTSDLDVEVDADDSGPTLPRVVQHRQHDFDLLVEVAARAGLLVTLDGSTLRLATLEGTGDPVALHYGESLFEVTVSANLDRAASEVTAVGWQPQRGEPLQAKVSSARSGRRVSLSAEPGQVGVDGSLSVVDRAAADVDDLTAMAQAALDTAVAGAVTVRGVCLGDPRLKPGSRIEIEGLSPDADGRYVVCEVVHTIDHLGYQTSFDSTPPPTRPGTGETSLTLGVVTAVDDPDGLGRVRVTLPALGDLDVGWLGVLIPGAGHDKGFVALPDVDDTVLVGLPHGGPAEGIVLGSIFGTVTPPDAGISGGSVKRLSWRSADGQSVVIDDDEHSIRLANDAGSFVELKPGKVTLHSAADLLIEAPGKAITVRASTVDFEQALL